MSLCAATNGLSHANKWTSPEPVPDWRRRILFLRGPTRRMRVSCELPVQVAGRILCAHTSPESACARTTEACHLPERGRKSHSRYWSEGPRIDLSDSLY